MSVDLADLRRTLLDKAKKRVPGSVRTKIVWNRLRIRNLTSRWRVLPDVLMVGAMRAGTSSMYKYLGYHPSIAPSLRKEVEYFTKFYRHTDNWYRAHFPLRARAVLHRRFRHEPLLSFEASPYLFFHELAPERAARIVPDAKILVMLRDPVDRTFSHWQLMVQHGYDDLSFEDALAAEPERLAREQAVMDADPLHFSERHYHCSYVGRSRYGEQLARWLEHYPPEQFAIVNSDALYADTAGIYHQVLDFIGARRWTPSQFENYSYLGAKIGKGTRTLDPATRDALRAELADDQALLADLIERHGLLTIGYDQPDPEASTP